jgi:hypothetical protein
LEPTPFARDVMETINDTHARAHGSGLCEEQIDHANNLFLLLGHNDHADLWVRDDRTQPFAFELGVVGELFFLTKKNAQKFDQFGNVIFGGNRDGDQSQLLHHDV